jgi:hypothetical protein
MVMRARRRLGLALALSILAAEASVGATATSPGTILLPTPGNVSLARLAIVARGAKAAQLPKLAVSSSGTLPPTVLVLGAVTRDRGQNGRFSATLAIFNRPPPPAPPGGSAPAPSPKEISIRLPSGYAFAGQQSAANVLYWNRRPDFALTVGGRASVLAGTPPPRIAPTRLLADALKLAMDQTVPIADMELIGLEYISAEVARGRSARYVVVIAVSSLNQVNAVQLTFPDGVRVVRAAGPPRSTVLPSASRLQLIVPDRFQEAVPYRFTFQLSRALSSREFFLLRASTHYFENVLPFTERFYVSA